MKPKKIKEGGVCEKCLYGSTIIRPVKNGKAYCLKKKKYYKKGIPRPCFAYYVGKDREFFNVRGERRY